MKKFVFSLQSLYEYKQTIEKLQKSELSRAEAFLRELQARWQDLEQAFERGKETQDEALRASNSVVETLAAHAVYFRHLNEERKKLLPKLREAEEERDRRRQELITTMKELKAYKKLREEQYARYLKEVQTEEEKAMNDLVSFKAISGDLTEASGAGDYE